MPIPQLKPPSACLKLGLTATFPGLLLLHFSQIMFGNYVGEQHPKQARRNDRIIPVQRLRHKYIEQQSIEDEAEVEWLKEILKQNC